MNYIKEANKFMYDDNYIAESVVRKEHLPKVKDFCQKYGFHFNERTGQIFKNKAAFLSMAQITVDGKMETSDPKLAKLYAEE